MPQTVELEMPFAGCSEEVAKPGETARVVVSGFYSSEDGLALIEKLEGAPSILLGKLCPPVPPSRVDHLLAVIDRSGAATIYVNELHMVAKARSAKSCKAGQVLTPDDVADVGELEVGVSIPAECGVVFVISVGWRKALYFDFGPLVSGDALRVSQIAETLGQVYSYLVYQERSDLTSAEWEAITNAGWFPFIGLTMKVVKTMRALAVAGRPIDEVTDEAAGEVAQRLDDWRGAWSVNASFSDHAPFLDAAIARFRDGDFISASSILYQRIEGLMRSNAASSCKEGKLSQKLLAQHAVPNASDGRFSPMLPARFLDYLTNVYFADFSPDDANLPANRNTISHGVVAAAQMSKKAAAVGFLIIRQLLLSFESAKK